MSNGATVWTNEM